MPHDPAPEIDVSTPADQQARDSTQAYSICTLVTDFGEYGGMVRSFMDGGFGTGDCEYLHLDNSDKNRFDAYEGYNLFLNVARGRYIILCHQDVLLMEDGRQALDRLLSQLDQHDPSWGLCGNAGGTPLGKRIVRISDPHGEDQATGDFPAKVTALDENFIVVRNDANLAVSHDLAGFHLYGSDICIIADVLGRSAYVIDFHLRHTSGGRVDHRFYEVRDNLVKKYARGFRTRWVYNTFENIFITGSPMLHGAASWRPVRYIWRLVRNLRSA